MIPDCWEVSDADRVLRADAGNDADLPGVFAATHRPVAAVKEQAGAPAAKLDDAAADALQVLAADGSDTNPLIVPVLGEPGTGKSHLVRWVWTQFGRLADPRFSVVYVPRARMSMAGVIERLLAAAQDDPDPKVAKAAQELIASARDIFEEHDADCIAANFATNWHNSSEIAPSYEWALLMARPSQLMKSSSLPRSKPSCSTAEISRTTLTVKPPQSEGG